MLKFHEWLMNEDVSEEIRQRVLELVRQRKYKKEIGKLLGLTPPIVTKIVNQAIESGELSPEDRISKSEIMKRRMAAMSPEERINLISAAQKAISPEQRAEILRQRWANMTPEDRENYVGKAKAHWADIPAEERTRRGKSVV